MADVEKSLLLKVLGDASGAVKAMGDTEKAAGGLGSTLGKIGSIASGFVLGSGLLQAPGMLIDMAKAAAEDEKASLKMDQALQNLSSTTEDGTAKLDQWRVSTNAVIATAQRKAFTDDEARESLQKLIASTGDYDEAAKRQAIAMDLARGAGIPLAQASTLLGKVTDENVNVFKRMGITMKDGATEADVLATVQAKFAGQADTYAKSTAGQFETAKIRMDEAKETIGYAVLPVMAMLAGVLADKVIPAFEGFANNVGPIADSVFKLIAQHGDALITVVESGAAAIGVLTVAMAAQAAIGFAGTIVGVTTAFLAMTEAEGFATAAQTLLNIAMDANPIGLVVLGLAALAAGAVLVWKNWDAITAALGRFAEAIEGRVVGAFNALKDGIKGALNYVIDGIDRVIAAWNAFDFSITIPFVGTITVGTPDMPLIPHLAEGGIVQARPGGTLALLGEGGRNEAVVPLGPAGLAGVGGNITVQMYGDVFGMTAFQDKVVTAIQQARARGSAV